VPAAGDSAATVAVVCLAACVLAGCGRAESRDDGALSPEVVAQIGRAKDATVPAGVTLTRYAGPTRKDVVVSAECTFEVQVGWAAYESEVTGLLRIAGYEPLAATDGGVAFAKHVPGDAYRVRIEREGSPSKLVTVRVSATPD